MTQKEFENLIGREVTAEKYQEIEMVYMADEGIDKTSFCNLWKEATPNTRYQMIKMAKAINEKNYQITSLKNENSEILEIMFMRANKMSDPELRKECIRRMGAKKYLQELLQSNYPLWEEDKQLLLQVL